MVCPESVDPWPAAVVLYRGPLQPMYGIAPIRWLEFDEPMARTARTDHIQQSMQPAYRAACTLWCSKA